ncbi:MAG TPA: hypothetical protein VHW90_07890 [Stellaceae bacterium]|jgi:hypothetical protein|nr:hypothetical protein [Stellaceae bacterium]
MALSAVAVVTFGMAVASPQIGQAQERGHEWRGGGRGWHGDYGRWRGGAWHHAWHNGRYGWWWDVPGYGWYFYDTPVYPYPEPSADAYGAPPQPGGGPGGPIPGEPGPGPGAGSWYYCANPPGYYPYVPQCYGPWQPVPPR